MRLVLILVGIVVLASFFPIRKRREFFDAAPKAPIVPKPVTCQMNSGAMNEPLKSDFVLGDYNKYCKKCTLTKTSVGGKLNLNCTQCQNDDKTACSASKNYEISIPTVNISDMK